MKFEKGEIAILVGSASNCEYGLQKYLGEEVEVIAYDDPECAYEVMARSGRRFLADPSCLRKRKPPASPFTFQEIIDMCNEDIRPTEIRVREGVKHG